MTGRLFVHGKKQRARKVKRGKEDVSQADMPNQAREISQPCWKIVDFFLNTSRRGGWEWTQEEIEGWSTGINIWVIVHNKE